MADMQTPVSASVTMTRRQQAITAAYGSAGEQVASTSPTSKVVVQNWQSFQRPIEYRLNSGAWMAVQPRERVELDADLSTDTLMLRRGEFAPASMVVDLELYSEPSGLLAIEQPIGGTVALSQGAATTGYEGGSLMVDPTTGVLWGIADGLGSTVAARAGRGRAMLDGDSKTANEWLTTVTENASVGVGVVNHANILGGRFLSVLENKGVVGNTTDDMLARLQTSLDYCVANRIGTVFLSLGTNDLFATTPRSADYVTSNLQTIVSAFLRIGCFVIWMNETPRSGSPTAAQVQAQLKVNRWGREYERNNPMFSVFDAAAVMVDPTSTAFAPRSGSLASGSSVHFNNWMAAQLGAAFKARYAALYPTTVDLIATAADTYATNSASGQVWSNPLFAGAVASPNASFFTATGGGSLPTGTVGTGVQVDHSAGATGDCVCSVVANADGIGSAQRCVIGGVTPSAANGRWAIRNQANMTSGVSPGDLIELEADVRVSGHTDLVALPLFLQAQVDGGTIVFAHDNRNDAANVAYPASFVGGTMRTRRLRMPSGTAVTALQWRVEPRFGAAGTGAATVDVSRVSVRNLTRLGIA